MGYSLKMERMTRERTRAVVPPRHASNATRSDHGANNRAELGDPFVDLRRGHGHERQTQRVVLRFIREERATGHERDVLLDLLLEQLHFIDVLSTLFWQLHPYEHAAFRTVPFNTLRHVLFERCQHGRALVSIKRADLRDMRLEETVFHDFVHDALRE